MGSKNIRSLQLQAESFTPRQQRWTTLWTTTLPRLASARSQVQNDGEWVVTVDHAFARVILDNVIGVDRPWLDAVAAPATANMTEEQLEACIALAEKIADGTIKLGELQNKSLRVRGIIPAKSAMIPTAGSKKRKRSATASSKETPPASITSNDTASKRTRKQQAAQDWSSISLVKTGPNVPSEEAEMIPDVQLIISQSTMKPFQKEALTLLTLVPRGRWTTYQAISNAMTKHKLEIASPHQASGHARAVGLAMRNNPFAPTVPCHRMLSSDMKIGGFRGDWEGEGSFFREKRRLLVEEGVRFDDRDRAVGEPFVDFG